jgi:hypothetical protein
MSAVCARVIESNVHGTRKEKSWFSKRNVYGVRFAVVVFGE